LILLHATDPAIRSRGLELLAKWTADSEWGASALRVLLADAQRRADSPAMLKWAEALRTHPRCAVSDMPNCLLALAQADENRFKQVLSQLEKDHAVSPKAATELLSWLNQIGRGRDAVTWLKTLPVAATRRPPLVVAAAESFRLTGEWSELAAWARQNEWGGDVDFLRWSYGLLAAKKVGDEKSAGELWGTLFSHAQRNSVHALFSASTLFSWGLISEAESLWWRAAEQEGQIAIDALGSLARFYQTRRDADGQYRVFRQLYLLRSHDTNTGNNLAFFAALTGREPRNADSISRENLAAEPQNSTYAATRAFVLLMQNRITEAQTVMKPFESQAGQSPALGFVQGLILARTNHQAEGGVLLAALPEESLTVREVELIKSSLAN